MRKLAGIRFLIQIALVILMLFAHQMMAAGFLQSRGTRVIGHKDVTIPTGGQESSRPDAPVMIHFLDVGQGSAVLIQTDGESMLVDAGSSWMGKQVVQYCRRYGVTSLNIVIASSPSSQKVGGMHHIFQNLPVQLYLDAGSTRLTSPLSSIARIAAREDISHENVHRKKVFQLGSSVAVEVLWPPSEKAFPSDEGEPLLASENVVLAIQIGQIRIFLPSDLPAEAERKLMRSGVKLDSTIMQLADHGARTSNSSGLLDEVSPEIAIASVGVYNERGVPHSEILDKLSERNISLMRTDYHGNITIGTDGSRWWIVSERKYESRSPMGNGE